MLAIFPALAALIALTGFLVNPDIVAQSLDLAADFLPHDAFALLDDQIGRLIGARPATLGWTSALSIAAAVWSARRGVGALLQGMNAIHGGPPRGGVAGTALTLALTATLIGVGLMALILMLLAPVALALLAPFLPQDSWLPFIAETLRWAVALSVLVLGLGLFYRLGPHGPGPRPRFFSPGLMAALALWIGASAGFTLFLAHFGNYNEVYGSIGAAVALMMWFYIAAYAILLGAALDAALTPRSDETVPPGTG